MGGHGYACRKRKWLQIAGTSVNQTSVVVRMQKYTDIVYSARNFLGMSSQQVRVASLLLEESFGELVEKVGGFLLRHGASSLAEIIRGTELKPNQVAAATID